MTSARANTGNYFPATQRHLKSATWFLAPINKVLGLGLGITIDHKVLRLFSVLMKGVASDLKTTGI